MKNVLNFMYCLSLVLLCSNISYAQSSCCAKGSKAAANCKTETVSTKACCSTAGSTASMVETTSGCTPSNCRGAKTKFGEAKVISNLRLELFALKEKMESHQDLKFSENAISVHDIIGETDDESLEIVAEHVALIDTEVKRLTEVDLPAIVLSTNKAKKVQQLNKHIVALNNAL